MEFKSFHVVACVMGTLLLGVVSWIALNAADIPVIKAEIASMDSRYNQSITWQTDKLTHDDIELADHEKRIQRIEDGK